MWVKYDYQNPHTGLIFISEAMEGLWSREWDGGTGTEYSWSLWGCLGRRGRRDVIQSDGSCNIEAAATNGKEKVTESLPLGGGREAHVERDDGGGGVRVLETCLTSLS